MTGFILFAVLILLLMSVLLLRVRLNLQYGEELALSLRVLFLKFLLFPKKKTPDVRSFSSKGIKKRLKKDREKALKKAVKDKNTKATASKKRKTDIIATVKLASDIISGIVGRLLKYLRIRVAKLHLTVGSEDAAKSALLYGLAVQGVQYIVAILDSVTDFSVERDGDIRVDCDFCLDESSLEIDMDFSIRVWQVISLALAAGAKFVLNSGKISKDDK